MGYNVTETSVLVQREPAKAAEKIARAIARAEGRHSEAAKALGVEYRTLTRWLEKLARGGHDVRARALELYREEHGEDAEPRGGGAGWGRPPAAQATG